MKNVKIYLVSKYEHKSKIGTWTYYLEYKGAVKKCTGKLENARSSARMLLVALIQAFQCINQPCDILVVSKTHLGLKNMHSSPNSDLLCYIYDIILECGHTVEFKTDSDFSCIEEWENQARIEKERAESEYYDRLAKEYYMMNHVYENL